MSATKRSVEAARQKAIERYPSGLDHFVSAELATRRYDFWSGALWAMKGAPTSEQIVTVMREHYGSMWCPVCHKAGQRDWSKRWDPIQHVAEMVAALMLPDEKEDSERDSATQ